MDEFSLYFTNKYFRYDILNLLIKKNNFKKYLEIGVATGDTFKNIECETKISVDPQQLGYTTYQMTSDEFFSKLDDSEKFDLIFIDGLHECFQCLRDLEHAILHLNENGYIVCHDMNPPNKWIARRNPEGDGAWCGDVYKSFITFRTIHLDYSCCLLYDCDWGLGIIKKGIGQKIKCDVANLNYEEFSNNKNYLMNCIDTESFVTTFCV